MTSFLTFWLDFNKAQIKKPENLEQKKMASIFHFTQLHLQVAKKLKEHRTNNNKILK